MKQTPQACFGVVCPKHDRCSRYHAVEQNAHPRIGTCVKSDGSRPLFSPAARLVSVPVVVLPVAA